MRPDPSLMLLQDALHGGQADPGPFEFLGTVEAMEWAKELFCAVQIETDAVVAHQKG